MGVVALGSHVHPQAQPNAGDWDNESCTLFIAQRKPLGRAQIAHLRNDGLYCFLEMNLFDTNDPVRGDSVVYDFFRAHMVALHTNEPQHAQPIGPRAMDWSQSLWAGVGGVGHGSHRDDHALTAILRWGYGKQVFGVLRYGTRLPQFLGRTAQRGHDAGGILHGQSGRASNRLDFGRLGSTDTAT